MSAGLGFVLSFGYWCTNFTVLQRAMAADSMSAARRTPLLAEVTRMAGESRTAMSGLVEQCRDEIEQIDARIRPGTIFGVGPTIAKLADADVPRDETPREAIAPSSVMMYL